MVSHMEAADCANEKFELATRAFRTLTKPQVDGKQRTPPPPPPAPRGPVRARGWVD